MSDKKKKDYVVNADGSVSVKIDDKNITIREPVVRDRLAVADIKSVDVIEITLLSNLTGLTIDEIEGFTWKNFHKLSQAGLHFSSFLD